MRSVLDRRTSQAPPHIRQSALVTPHSLGLAFVALASLLLIPRLLTFIQLTTSVVAWPWQFDFDEGINLNATVLLSQGHNIYRINGPDSFVAAPYSPLFYVLNLPSTWLFGPSFAFGRALSLLATLSIAVLLAYVVRKITGSWGGGALAALVWLSASPVIVWGPLYKQDMPAYALGLLGLALALTITYPQDKRLYIAALIFAIAFFTKQYALSAMVATTLWLLLRDWRLGARFIGALLLFGGVPFIVLNLVLKGGLWAHIVDYQNFPWTFERQARVLLRLWGEYWPIILWGLAGLIVAAIRILKPSRHELLVTGHWSLITRLGSPWTLGLLYALIGSASTLTQSGVEEANYNHLLDIILALSLLVGLFVGWLLSRLDAPEGLGRSWLLGGLALSAVLLLAQLFSFQDPRTWYRGNSWPTASHQAEMQGLSNLVARTPGDYFSEDAYIVLHNGRALPYDDPSTFVPLAQIGKWNESGFVQSIRDRRYSLIFLMRGSVRWSDAGLKAFQENYSLKFPGSFDTYEPKLNPDAPQYALQCAHSRDTDAVSLTGYSLAPGVTYNGLKRGDTLRLALYWHPERKVQHSYASFVHLLNEKGDRVAGRDNPATGAPRPTHEWEPGKLITDTTAIPLPADMPPGRYRLVAGMYRQENGALLNMPPTCTRGEAYGDGVPLGWVEVK